MITAEIFLELVNKAIDGVLTSKEELKLKQYLEVHPGAQKIYDDMKRVTTILDGVSEVEPPASLGQRIVNAVNSHVPPRLEKGRLSWQWILPHIVRHRMGYACLAGAAAGVLVFTLLTVGVGHLGSVDGTTLYGTLVDRDIATRMSHCASVAVDLNGVTGSITTKRGKDIVCTDLELESREALDFQVSFDGRSLHFLGVGQTEGSSHIITVTDGSVTIEAAGKNHYSIFFKDENQQHPPVRCSFMRGGVLLSEYDLKVTTEE
jgi:hypothetical protein